MHSTSQLSPEVVTAVAAQFGKPAVEVLDLLQEMRPVGNGPFMVKYQPKSEWALLDVELVRAVKDYIRGFTPDSPKALLLVGPCSCGKTSLVRAIAQSEGLAVVLSSCKDQRNGQALQRLLGEATQSRKVESMWKPSLVLLDDVDVVFDSDKGFHKAVNDVISRSKQPVVLTATQPPEDFISVRGVQHGQGAECFGAGMLRKHPQPARPSEQSGTSGG